MIQRGDGAGFAIESVTKSFGRDLDGDNPVEPRVASLPHFAHPSRTDGREDFVRAEFITC
jgi:hypothetical protein